MSDLKERSTVAVVFPAIDGVMAWEVEATPPESLNMLLPIAIGFLEMVQRHHPGGQLSSTHRRGLHNVIMTCRRALNDGLPPPIDEEKCEITRALIAETEALYPVLKQRGYL